jgi:hypothetical protein
MRRIFLTTMSPEWDWARQTPCAAGIWNGAQFILNAALDPGGSAAADWWVVYDDLPQEASAEVTRGQTILVTPEPPALKRCSEEFAAQFDWVITSDRELQHPRKVYMQQGLPWHVGRRQSAGKNLGFSKSYDELTAAQPPKGQGLVSVIASDKAHTPGHRARRDFVRLLEKHFGKRLAVFGWGGREIEDKWDGIAPFRYHIAIENSATPDYWTEKLADAYLAGAFPIYYGCPNIGDYFPKSSMARIDIHEPAQAIETIERVLHEDCFNAQKIAEARDLVLHYYSLFPLLENFCAIRERPRERALKTLRPAKAFYKEPTLLERAARCLSLGRKKPAL